MERYTIELKWAVLFSGMTLAWMLGERISGLHDHLIEYHAGFSNLIMIPAISLYVLALRDKKKNFFRGEMKYREALLSGLMMTLIITLLSPVVQVITSMFITPGFFRNMADYSVSQGKMSQADAEKYFSLPSYIIQVLIFTPVMGAATTAVVALFVRSRES